MVILSLNGRRTMKYKVMALQDWLNSAMKYEVFGGLYLTLEEIESFRYANEHLR